MGMAFSIEVHVVSVDNGLATRGLTAFSQLHSRFEFEHISLRTAPWAEVSAGVGASPTSRRLRRQGMPR